MSDVDARIRELEKKVLALEDRNAIQELRFRYHIAVNDLDLHSIASLFVEDGEVEFEGIGKARGREEIDQLYEAVVGSSPFVKQFIHNHSIQIDGDRASGLSYLDARTVTNGESFLVAARFDDAYLRTDAGWRFSELRLALYFAVPLREGWAGENKIQLPE